MPIDGRQVPPVTCSGHCRGKSSVNRRTFLKIIPFGAAAALAGHGPRRGLEPGPRAGHRPAGPRIVAGPPPPIEPMRDEGARVALDPGVDPLALPSAPPDFHKIKDFDRTYDDDLFLAEDRRPLLKTAALRLTRAQRTIGHGHFNLLGFDDLLRYTRRYSKIGRFTAEELELLEELFAADATRYGFRGEKVLTEMSSEIPRREVQKISGTGHYLFRGDPVEKYAKIRDDLGTNVVLTSGIRGLVKQYHLFLMKAVGTGGNLSQASRSLAPPGYSFHAAGDFDVGKVGFGADNFTEAFAETDEYKRLIDLGYVEIRYTETNPFGVRHEPWHIKIG